MNFKQFRKDLTEAFDNKETRFFLTDVEKDTLWNTYLGSFPLEQQQEYTCNSCRQFIKNYANMVSIVDNKIVTMWDFVATGDYVNVPARMKALVESAAIKDIFVTDSYKLGTLRNNQMLEGGEIIQWDHLYLELPKAVVSNLTTVSAESIKGTYRSTTQVFKRALDEITLSAIDTVLELIAQGSLYRGTEFTGQLQAFRTVKVKYDALPEDQKENYAWLNSNVGGAITNIRSGAIGTLLVNVSEGMELDPAVGKFEAIMAPANYKRPKAIITQKQIQEAEKKIEELGFADSLGRRFAVTDDVTVNNVLYVNRDKIAGSLLGALKEDITVNPKNFDKVEDVTVKDFVEKILPKCTDIEILVENRHNSNFMSLIAPKNSEAKSMFKWPNAFSWSYRNALADSGMKDRVKTAGGHVEGVLRFSIQWNDDDTKYPRDFDAHAQEPKGEHIYFGSFRGSSRTVMTGNLDVDMTGGPNIMVENITWRDKSKMRDGEYRFWINNFSRAACNGFKAQIEMDGEIHEFFYPHSFLSNIEVATVTLKNGVFTIQPALPASSGVSSQEIWGIKTSMFHKVNFITKSPNFWGDSKIGNEHLFFIIDKVKTDEEPRGFFNEFLNQDLDVHKRVFEALGGKMKVEPADDQLSGLGFSSTKKDEVIVKVTGAFSRIIRIKF